MNILIAEDEQRIAQALKKSLEAENFHAEIADNGDIALDKLKNNQYDALLLDWRMPKVNGLEVCRKLRDVGNTIPIILLTVLSDISNKVEALNVGADDYITKPFSFSEVHARLCAVLRRSQTEQKTILFGGLNLNLVDHTINKADLSLKLPEMEFELLCYLIEHKQMIVNKEQLAKEVWKLSFLPNTNFVEVTIKNLRKKLEPFGAAQYVKTIYGEGYSFIDDAE